MRHRSALQLAGAAGVAGTIVAALALPTVGGVGLLAQHTAEQIQPVALSVSALPQRSTIEAADGSVLGRFFTQDRVDVPLNQVSPTMQKAIVAIEDSRFWTNGALDLKGTLRALVHNNQGSSGMQGASTLVQQYVKNVLEDDASQKMTVAKEKISNSTNAAAKAAAQAAYNSAQKAYNEADAPNVSRKITELKYAIWVESHNSKQQILDDYLNAVWFAGSREGNNSVYGVEAAAEYYFGENAGELNLPQSALLAGMVNNAGLYDPETYPTNATNRRNTVLARMAQLKQISQAQADAAEKMPLGLHITSPGGSCGNSSYPFFCEYIQDEIENNPALGSTVLNTGGLTIHTTLNIKAQAAAQKAMNDLSPASSSFVGMEAMVKPGTGAIEAIAQSRRYGYGRHATTIDYAVDDAHGGLGDGVQAGSTFKLFTLLAALSKGYGAGTTYSTPPSMNLSGFYDCAGNDLGPWPVQNAEKSEGKSNNLDTATWESVNTYYAQLERSVGLCSVAKMAAKLGMVNPSDGSPLKLVPSFTLGSNGIDILHEDAAYAAVAAGGIYCSPVAITGMVKVTNGQASPLPVPSANCHRVLSAGVADEATSILQGVLTKPGGTAVGDGIPGRQAAGKTGTTDNKAMALFAGYTPDLSAVVWYGDPGSPFGDPVGEFGAYTAPYWERSMAAALG